MGVACSKHGRQMKKYAKLRSENLKGRNNWEGLGVDGKIILK